MSTVDGPFDITVIGGGIHGAGVAQAAAAAGYKTLLVEKSHWAAGTSSKSSKLIHGGLRYLQSGQLGLVRESLKERQILLEIAPHLVKLVAINIPVYQMSAIRPWQLTLGLGLYYALSGCHKNGKFQRLPRRTWSELVGLTNDGLQKIFRYCDAQTDDAALTRAVVDSAAACGAQLACPALFIGADRQPQGYTVRLSAAGIPQSIQTRVLINCAGPWINTVAAKVSPSVPQPNVDLVQGTHLVLSHPTSGHAYYLESASDGRAVFVLPWQGQTLLGTTETLFQGDPDQVAPTAREEAYLLNVFRQYFPNVEPQVAASMAGLRVLPGGARQPFRRSREVNLVGNDKKHPSYVAVYGGKLTGYRATAEKVLKQIAGNFKGRPGGIDTATLPLP